MRHLIKVLPRSRRDCQTYFQPLLIHVDCKDSQSSCHKTFLSRSCYSAQGNHRAFGQSVKTCRRPEELPPSKAFFVGWNATTGSTVLRFSSSVKVCWSWPVSWNTCTLRGFNMFAAAKHPSCLGSHTADILLSQRPVCISCLKAKMEMTGCKS